MFGKTQHVAQTYAGCRHTNPLKCMNISNILRMLAACVKKCEVRLYVRECVVLCDRATTITMNVYFASIIPNGNRDSYLRLSTMTYVQVGVYAVKRIDRDGFFILSKSFVVL